MKKIFAPLLALMFASAAYGQSGTVNNHAFAVGKGPSVSGYTSVLCGSGQLPIGTAGDPVCRTVTGDGAISAAGVLTLATVNANVGSFGSTTNCASFTVNGKGLITAASQAGCAFPTAANPTATAGSAAVNGAAATFMRSDAAPAVQKGTNVVFGIVEGDGSGICITAGVAALCNPYPTAANPTATAGPAAVNGSAATFMRSDAAPAVQKGTNAQFGIVEGDGTTIKCDATPGVCVAQRNAIFPTPTRAGDIMYWNGSTWVTLAGNNSSTQILQETSAGVPSFVPAPVPEPQGRLTLTTGTPVMTGNVAGATSVLYTPAKGNLVPVYDGTNLVPVSFSELSNVNANSSTGNAGPAAVAASSCYDYFMWSNSGTPTLTRGPAWTNTTTRSAGTALTRVNGVLLNNATITNGPAASRGTYVGTACSNSGSTFDWNTGGSASGGTAGTLMVWNTYNRVTVSAQVLDSGVAYTYSSGTVRQARASAGNQITAVFGLAEDGAQVVYSSRIGTVAVGAGAVFGLGVDSTTTFQCQPATTGGSATSVSLGASNSCVVTPMLGQHVFSANEQSDGTNANNYDVASLNALGAQLRM